MADATGILQTIKKAAVEAQESVKPVNVYFGKVISGNPVEIEVEQKMRLGEKQLIMSGNVTDHVVTISVNWETEDKRGGSGEDACALHRHGIQGRKQIVVYNGLTVGDEVILLRQQEGQRFIVLDRIGGKG